MIIQKQNYTFFFILKNKCQTNLLYADAFVKSENDIKNELNHFVGQVSCFYLCPSKIKRLNRPM